MRFLVFFLIISGALAWARDPDPYDILGKVPLYSDLTAYKQIRSYRVPVFIQGKMWEEIRKCVQNPAGEDVGLVEYGYDPHTVVLRLTRKGIPLNEMIPGMLDPVQIFGLVLRQLESFRNPNALQNLKRNSMATWQQTGKTHSITLIPSGAEFLLREYMDLGRESVQSRVNWIKVEIEEPAFLARVLEFRRIRIIRSMALTTETRDTSVVRFELEYLHSGDRWYPEKLKSWKNGKPELSFETRYKTSGGILLPEKKTMKYRMGDQFEQADIEYGHYELNIQLPPLTGLTPKEVPGERVRKANEISLRAQKAIDEGKIMEAMRWMKTLADAYPDTPQARQAKIFLDGLP